MVHLRRFSWADLLLELPMPVKVVTININAAILFDPLLESVRHQKPDVLMLQELFISHESKDRRFHILERLQQILRQYDIHRAATYDTFRHRVRIEAGNAILSRFPIAKGRSFFYTRCSSFHRPYILLASSDRL